MTESNLALLPSALELDELYTRLKQPLVVCTVDCPVLRRLYMCTTNYETGEVLVEGWKKYSEWLSAGTLDNAEIDRVREWVRTNPAVRDEVDSQQEMARVRADVEEAET